MQQTQDPTQRRSDKQIVNEVLGGDYGRDHGIGQKLKKSVRSGDSYSSQSSTSQNPQSSTSQTQPPPQWTAEQDAHWRQYTASIQQMGELLKAAMPDQFASFHIVPPPMFPPPAFGSQMIRPPPLVPPVNPPQQADDDDDGDDENPADLSD